MYVWVSESVCVLSVCYLCCMYVIQSSHSSFFFPDLEENDWNTSGASSLHLFLLKDLICYWFFPLFFFFLLYMLHLKKIYIICIHTQMEFEQRKNPMSIPRPPVMPFTSLDVFIIILYISIETNLFKSNSLDQVNCAPVRSTLSHSADISLVFVHFFSTFFFYILPLLCISSHSLF